MTIIPRLNTDQWIQAAIAIPAASAFICAAFVAIRKAFVATRNALAACRGAAYKLQRILSEVTPNGGNSLKDRVSKNEQETLKQTKILDEHGKILGQQNEALASIEKKLDNGTMLKDLWMEDLRVLLENRDGKGKRDQGS